MLALPFPRADADADAESRALEMTRADVRLIRQAIRGRWPIDADKRGPLIESLIWMATHPDRVGARAAIAAAKAILDADKINMADEQREEKKPKVIDLGDGRTLADFSDFTDEELDRYLEG